MRVTIIRDDNVVLVNGEGYTVDCKDLPADFHALQWDGVGGEIEYSMIVCDHCKTRSKKPNAMVTDLAPYQKYVDQWQAAKVHSDAERAAAEAAAIAAQEQAKIATAEKETRDAANLAAAVESAVQAALAKKAEPNVAG
jgi:hypothetical protein